MKKKTLFFTTLLCGSGTSFFWVQIGTCIARSKNIQDDELCEKSKEKYKKTYSDNRVHAECMIDERLIKKTTS